MPHRDIVFKICAQMFLMCAKAEVPPNLYKVPLVQSFISVKVALSSVNSPKEIKIFSFESEAWMSLTTVSELM